MYTSFAVFTEEKQFNVINGTYQDPGDIYFAVYIDGEITNTFPSKDSGYTLDAEKSSCTNGATVSWDINKWGAFVDFTNYQAGNMSRTKCTMYFVEADFCDLNPDAATCTILALGDSSDELMYDETSDNNLRYIGANPNNYISFNNELWRIIGVFNNIDNGSGIKETRLKIIRDEPIGTYSWDNKASGTGSSISEYGSNDWRDSALQLVLNEGAYYNRTSGECPYGQNGATTACDFSSNGLTSEAKSMISNAVWNLGGTTSYTTALATDWYSYERGTTVYSERPTSWTGQIGLMYPSDYGYATSGGNTGRNACLSYSLYDWSSYSDCKNNSWLYKDGIYQWTFTPHSGRSDSAYRVYHDGLLGNFVAYDEHGAVSPVLYLSSGVKITGGDGSEESPFNLSL